MAVEFDRSRRAALRAGLALAVSTLWPGAAIPAYARRALCSGRIRQTESGLKYEVATLAILSNDRLREISSVELPSRAHGIVPTGEPGEIIVCARRPGAWLMRIRVADGTVLARYDEDGDCWLQGHAFMSHDGTTVFAGEVDLQERSTIGVFDAKTLRRIATLPSGGIEPHELITVDASTLLIAHGGRRDTLRGGDSVAENALCESSLTWLDTNSGRVINALRCKDRRISLRHLAKVRDGSWAVGAQSGANEPLAMVALFDRERLHWLACEPRQTANYVASLSASAQGIVATAPHANRVLIWGAERKNPEIYEREYPYGIAFDSPYSSWVAGEKLGPCSLRSDACRPLVVSSKERISWDNHMSALAL